MAKPTAAFPISVLDDYQEISTVMDIDGVIVQLDDVAVAAIYAASGAIEIQITGSLSAWPNYGFVENQTTNELMFWSSKTVNTLVIKASGRGLGGTTPTAGAISQNIRFLEARILGKAINQLFAEVTAMEYYFKNTVEFDTDGSCNFLAALTVGGETVVLDDDARLTDSRTPTSHNHSASDITSGTIPPAQLGSGTPDNTKYLRGDGAWVTQSATTAGATGNVQFKGESGFEAETTFNWDNTNKVLGIGIATPTITHKLHLSKNTSSGNGGLLVENTGIGPISQHIKRTGGTAAEWLTYIPITSTELRLNNGTSDLFSFTTTGFMGIGKIGPTDILDLTASYDGGRGILVQNSNNGTSALTHITLYNDLLDYTYLSITSSSGTRIAELCSNVNLYIKANGAKDVIFYTNSAERMRINSSGYVGIGITPSTYRLRVKSAASNSYVSAFVNYGETANLLINEDNSGNFLLWLQSADGANKICLNSAGDSYLNGGCFGINISNPDYLLHIKSIGSVSLGVFASTGSSYIVMYENSGASKDMRIYGADTAGVVKFNIDTGGDSYINGGDLGVGVADPQFKIDVDGQIGLVGLLASGFTNAKVGGSLTTLDTGIRFKYDGSVYKLAINLDSGVTASRDYNGSSIYIAKI